MGDYAAGTIPRDEPPESLLRVVKPAVPAAGADPVVTVPGGECWALLSARFTLVTSVAVANRQVELRVDDGSDRFYAHTVVPTQAASLTRSYCFATRLGYEQAAFAGTALDVGIPRLELPAGTRILLATAALDAADQWAAPVLLVREIIKRGASAELAYQVRRLADSLDALDYATGGLRQ